MCHGSLDPKYLMRDIEARVKSHCIQQDSIQQDSGTDRQPSAARALLAWVRRHLPAAASPHRAGEGGMIR